MLTWNWNEACGIAVIRQGERIWKTVIRPCNGLFVIHYQYIDENGEERALPITFAVDKKHLKNCAKDGAYDEFEYVEFYKGCKGAEKLAKVFIELGIQTHYINVPFDPPFKLRWDIDNV